MPSPKEIQKQIRNKVLKISHSRNGYKIISTAVGPQQMTVTAIIHKWPADQNNPKSAAITHPTGHTISKECKPLLTLKNGLHGKMKKLCFFSFFPDILFHVFDVFSMYVQCRK